MKKEKWNKKKKKPRKNKQTVEEHIPRLSIQFWLIIYIQIQEGGCVLGREKLIAGLPVSDP